MIGPVTDLATPSTTRHAPSSPERVEPTPAPKRIAPLPHLASLDGLRGLAVLAVMLFHSEFTWMRGGFLGVSLFFTLSGFLIGSLVLREHSRSGTLDLVAFWRRRFRRLLPAALICIAVALILGQFAFGPSEASHVGGDALASLAYVANWRFLASGQSYGSLFSAPSPLQHFWSLAIEEQFYVFFPMLALVLLKFGRKWFATGMVAISVAAVLIARASTSADRVYYGTDTRAAELAVGVLLALWYVRRSGRTRRPPRWALWLGPLALLSTLILWVRMSQGDDWLRTGGFAIVAGTSAALILGAVRRGPMARMLSVEPLVYVGRISYGLYLYHWPLFIWLNNDRLGISGLPANLIRWTATFAAAIVSARIVELPIRRGTVLARRWWPSALAGVAIIAGCSVVSASSAVPYADPFAPTEHKPIPLPPSAAAPGDNVAPAPVPGAAPSVAVAPVAPVAPPPPPRILVLGDSTGHTAGVGLSTWADRSGESVVYDFSAPGCSFVRAELYRGSRSLGYRNRDASCDWEKLWPDVVREFQPDVIVMVTSAMDVSEFKLPDKRVIGVGDAAGDAFVAGEMDAVIDTLSGLAPSARIAWTTGPYNEWKWSCPEKCLTRDRDRMDAYNALVDALPTRHPDVQVIPYGEHLNAANGSSGKVDKRTRPDGVHLSEDAALMDAATWFGPQILALR